MSGMTDVVLRRTSNEIALNLALLQDKPVFLQEYIVRHVARELVSREIEFNTARGILAISNSETGAMVSLSRDAVCYRNRNELIFKNRYPRNAYRHLVQLDKQYDFEHFHFGSTIVPRADFSEDPHTEFVDAGSLGNQLTLRTWNDGDAFVPLGMNDKKKVSDFFIDEKIPLFEKHLVPIHAHGLPVRPHGPGDAHGNRARAAAGIQHPQSWAKHMASVIRGADPVTPICASHGHTCDAGAWIVIARVLSYIGCGTRSSPGNARSTSSYEIVAKSASVIPATTIRSIKR